MEVHKILGNGFQERIYQRALAIEMELQGLNFSREQEMQVYYKFHKVGTRRADFLVEKVVSVETKALSKMDEGDLSLQFKRLINSKFNNIIPPQ